MTWNIHRKPDPQICPQNYCFFWQDNDTFVADGIFSDLQTALVDLQKGHEGCGCPFGICIRLEPSEQGRDWYEPNEPALLQSGLPWFYFIDSPHSLDFPAKNEYIERSEKLWGEKHWLKSDSS